MYWQDMVQALSWPCLAAMNAILNLQSILIFRSPILSVSNFNGEEANPTKDALLENSDFLNGIVMRDAIPMVIKKLEEMGIGNQRVNYKMRDAAFSRQRYWGEPFPIIWKNGIAYPLDENELPLELPKVETYKPGPDGEGPLANMPEWTAKTSGDQYHARLCRKQLVFFALYGSA